MTIVQFLLDRVADDEAVARRAQALLDADPHASDDGGAELFIGEAGGDAIVGANPARVLAECEAKRYVIAQYREVDTTRGGDAQSRFSRTLAAMAAVYRDHPDYDSAWTTTPTAPPF